MSQIQQPRAHRPLGIIGATGPELGFLKKRIEPIEKGSLGKGRFFRGRLSGKELVLVESGIGHTHAADTCLRMIERFSPLAILSLGLAGSVDTHTKIGDILLVSHLLEIKDMETLGVEKTYTLDKGLIYIISNILDKYDLAFNMGKVATAPSFIFRHDERHRIGRELKVKAVEMEGTAIAAEAMKHLIPLMALRLISDDMSSPEIDWGMALGPLGKLTLRAGIRFSFLHRGDLQEVFRFGRRLRQLAARLSKIGTDIVEEISFLPTDPVRGVDLCVPKGKVACTCAHSTVMGEGSG